MCFAAVRWGSWGPCMWRHTGDLGLSVDQHGTGLAVAHANTLKDVPSILALVEEEAVGPLLY
jgi:hypothetical protein